MVLFVNPRAGGGTAMKRWSVIRHDVGRRIGGFTEVFLDGNDGLNGNDGVHGNTRLDEVVRSSFRRGERHFVAAGGDGTVNALLNSIMRFRGDNGFSRVALGAVGLGSSNDFHKQSAGNPMPELPSRIDFRRLRRQDVGCIDARGHCGIFRRYFIVNASLGVTAEGNSIFNRTSGMVALLKQVSTNAAISWAALAAIIRHVNTDLRVSFDGEDERPVRLSNLAVLKNPSISGEMRAAVRVSCDDGRLGVWMEEDLSRTALLKLFFSLNSDRFSLNATSTIGACRSLRVRGTRQFPVEFDGEIIYANDVEFSLLPGALEVCQ